METGFWVTLVILYALGAVGLVAIVKSGHDADEAMKRAIRRPNETANGCSEENE